MTDVERIKAKILNYEFITECDVEDLITTIESQQEKNREELQVLMNSSNTKIWNLQDDVKQKDALIESQKEEIAEAQRSARYWQGCFDGASSQIASLKAITELAVKGLERISVTFERGEMVRLAYEHLHEIKEMQNGTT